ncbi:MAG TPA: polysaccharide deacetylase family protein [bacterium (Candidatus Stahlbacteria)]|nr:polysaccharide deacetylase family protein [Candidatus Stahlbacteria bacterium]
MLRIITFHKVRSFDLGGTWNTPKQMESFFAYIVANKIDVISLSALAADPAGYLADTDLHLLLTFDDGDDGIYRLLLPMIRTHSIPVCVFLITGFIGRSQSWDIINSSRQLGWSEIRELRELGVEFGSHSVTHRDLTRLNDRELWFELEESKRVLAGELGSCFAISYPYDRVDNRVIRMAEEAGYRIGFGNKDKPPFSIVRERVFRTDTLGSFKIKTNKADSLLLRWERFKARVINIFSIASMKR